MEDAKKDGLKMTTESASSARAPQANRLAAARRESAKARKSTKSNTTAAAPAAASMPGAVGISLRGLGRHAAAKRASRQSGSHQVSSSAETKRGLRRNSANVQRAYTGQLQAVPSNTGGDEEVVVPPAPANVDEENVAPNQDTDRPEEPTTENEERTGGLVEARAVNEASSMHLVSGSAQEVDPYELEKRDEAQKKERQCQKLGAAIVLLAFLVIAITLAVVFTRDDGVEKVRVPAAATDNATETFDTQVSLNATAVPTNIMDQFVETVLPSYTKEALVDPFSPQAAALDWLSNHPYLANFTEPRLVQLFAVATFYHSFDGSNWPTAIQESWLDNTKHECDWYSSFYGGYDADGRYTPKKDVNWLSVCSEDGIQILGLSGLNLTHNNPIMPREIALLTALSYINLHDNGIVAPLDQILTSEIYELPNLQYLYLSHNSLAGSLSSKIGTMTSLRGLDFSESNVSGTIHTEVAFWRIWSC